MSRPGPGCPGRAALCLALAVAAVACSLALAAGGRGRGAARWRAWGGLRGLSAPAATAAALPLCNVTSNDFTDGTWVFDPSHVGPRYTDRCVTDPTWDCRHPAFQDLMRWRWVPASCRLVDVPRNISHSCSRQRRVLLSGDHLANQLRDTLQCGYGFLLAAHHHSSFLAETTLAPDATGRKKPKVRLGEEVDSQLLEALEQQLFHSVIMTSREGPWLSARHRHTLLDANGTALSEQQLQSTWRRSVQRTLHAVDRLQPGVSVLWLSPAPLHSDGGRWGGAPRCHPSHGPQSSAPMSENVRYFEAALQGTLRAAASAAVLNLSALSTRRPDAHPANLTGRPAGRPDCRHWCVPGLLDTWARVLLTHLCGDLVP